MTTPGLVFPLLFLVAFGTTPGLPPAVSPHRWFGISFAFCGDLDCDGVEEIAIGSPFEGEHEVGALYTYSIATGKRLARSEGPSDGQWFAVRIVAVPDLDGDGVPEVAARTGRARGYSTGGTIEIRSGRDGGRLKVFEVPPDEGLFGSGLASIGDVDGDGIADMATVSHGGRSRERIRILSVRTGDCLFSFEGLSDARALHERRFATLGDVDGDSCGDLAALAGGELLFLSPKHGIVLQSWRDADLKPRVSSGTALCLAGDLDADGKTDLLVGHGWPSGERYRTPGRLQVRSGADGRIIKTILADHLVTLGTDVALAGDVDRDGTEDWWVSDQDFLGGRVALFSGSTGRVLLEADRAIAGDGYPWIGWQIEVGPDLDGDGVRDLAASCIRPLGECGLAGQGVIVFSGRTGKVLRRFVLASDERGGRAVPPD